MPASDLWERVAGLRRSSASFALATVVRSRRPASARPGDRAVVLADGSMEGWVGGSCAQTTIQREGLRALSDGRPRLVRLSPEPDPSGDEEGVVSYPMTCHSGGVLEVYVEPVLPPPSLVVVGDSPVAEALSALAPTLGFSLDRREGLVGAVGLDRAADAWVVVAGMGERDEESVEAALRLGVPYVGLVASRRRAAGIVDFLQGRGLGDDVSRLKSPAGLDLGAADGPEVALSILAEIVQRRRSRPAAPAVEARPPETAVDPICGMDVEIASARWTSTFQGSAYYFCAPGCRRRFDANPQQYVGAVAETG